MAYRNIKSQILIIPDNVRSDSLFRVNTFLFESCAGGRHGERKLLPIFPFRFLGLPPGLFYIALHK